MEALYPQIERLARLGVKRTSMRLLIKKWKQAAPLDDSEGVIHTSATPDADMDGAADELFVETGHANNAVAGTSCQKLRVGYVDTSGDPKEVDTAPTGITGITTGITDGAYLNYIMGILFGGTKNYIEDDAWCPVADGGNKLLICDTSQGDGIIDGSTRFHCGANMGAIVLKFTAEAYTKDIKVRWRISDLGDATAANRAIYTPVEQLQHNVNVKDEKNELPINLAGDGIPIPSNCRFEGTIQNLTATEDGSGQGDLVILFWENPSDELS
jgi:hypothetical protein